MWNVLKYKKYAKVRNLSAYVINDLMTALGYLLLKASTPSSSHFHEYGKTRAVRTYGISDILSIISGNIRYWLKNT